MPTANPKTSDKKTAVTIAVIVIGLGIWVGSAMNSWSEASQQPRATFEGSVANHNVIDSSTVVLALKVKNTGSLAGTPSCFIQVKEKTGQYGGSDTFTFTEIQPGQEGKFGARLTVSNDGASRITDASVVC